MRDSPGELSKKDSEELCKKIDQEMHELFEEIEGAQRKLDALVWYHEWTPVNIVNYPTVSAIYCVMIK